MKTDENFAVEIDLETKIPRHVLQLSCGITVELMLDAKTGQALCIWSARPTLQLMPTILREYPRWRDEILEAWSQRSGQISRSISTAKMALIAGAEWRQQAESGASFPQSNN